MNNLNRIPQDAKTLPDGVAEFYTYTRHEMNAFLKGIHFIDPNTPLISTPFQKDHGWVVRIVSSNKFNPNQIDELYKE